MTNCVLSLVHASPVCQSIVIQLPNCSIDGEISEAASGEENEGRENEVHNGKCPSVRRVQKSLREESLEVSVDHDAIEQVALKRFHRNFH